MPGIDPDAPFKVDSKLEPFREVCRALTPLADSASEDGLIIVPHGALHRFPFAAVGLSDGRTLGASVPVSSAPSMSVLALGLSRTAGGKSSRVDTFSVTCAEDNDPAMIETADDHIALGVDVGSTIGIAASKEAVLTALGSADVVHLTCHGIVDPIDPLESGLLLSDGNFRPPLFPSGPGERLAFVLTAREILRIRSTCRLVFVACLFKRRAAGAKPRGRIRRARPSTPLLGSRQSRRESVEG